MATKKTKKTKPRTKMTINEKRLADKFLETGNKTEAGMQTFNCKNRASAQVLAHKTLKRPVVLTYLKEQEELAKQTITELCVNGESEFVRLNAAKDILDRNIGKANQIGGNKEGGSSGDTYNILIQRYDKREGENQEDSLGDGGRSITIHRTDVGTETPDQGGEVY